MNLSKISRGYLDITMVACLITVILVIVLSTNRGINLSDESFYLLWIADPSGYSLSVTPFGIVFKPVYDLFGHSIVMLRLFGLFLLLGSGALLGWNCNLFLGKALGNTSGRVVLPVLGALFQTSYYVLWILTPSYNLLANVSAAVTLSGCLGWATYIYSPKNKVWLDRLSSILVGAGGSYAFLAKPTFALTVSVFAFGGILLFGLSDGSKRTVERIIIAGLSCLLVLVGHVHYSMPIPVFIRTLIDGSNAFSGSHSMLDIPIRAFVDILNAPKTLIASVIFLLSSFVWALLGRKTKPPRAIIAISAMVLVSNVWVLAFACWSTINLNRIYWTALGPEIYGVLSCTVGLGLLVRLRNGNVEKPLLALIAILMMMPFAIALGSANPFIKQTSISMFSALLGTSLALKYMFDGHVGKLVGTGLSVGVLLLVVGSIVMPYRLTEPVYRQLNSISIPSFKGTIYADTATKTYFDALRSIVKREKFTPGTPILDLSGGGPGSALFLEGRPAGNPWLVPLDAAGGRLADTFWSTLSRSEKKQAWVLGPIHPGFRETQVVKLIAAKASSYECVGASTMDFWEPYGVPELVSVWRPATKRAFRSLPPGCDGARLSPSP